MPQGRVEVAALEQVVYLRVIGLGNALRSLAMKRLLEEQLRRGEVARLVVDLRECVSLDSTFMGTLLGIAATLDEARNSKPAVLLANPAEHVRSQLANLGLLDVEPLILLAAEEVAFPPATRMAVLPELQSEAELDSRLHTILDAHKRLIALTPENEARFGPFLRTLIAEIQTKGE